MFWGRNFDFQYKEKTRNDVYLSHTISTVLERCLSHTEITSVLALRASCVFHLPICLLALLALCPARAGGEFAAGRCGLWTSVMFDLACHSKRGMFELLQCSGWTLRHLFYFARYGCTLSSDATGSIDIVDGLNSPTSS